MGNRYSVPIVDNNTVIIAVMGVTGSGKSTLIRTLTQERSVAVGHGLESVTTEIRPHYFTHRGVRYCLVDTPGFNDTYYAHDDVAYHIIDWLTENFRHGTRLNGVLYLHSIGSPRMPFSSRASLQMFRKLCGDDACANVVLATTFWDVVPAEVARQREREFHEKFAARMLQNGARTARITPHRATCLRLVEDLAASHEKMVLEVQRDVVDRGRSIYGTLAWGQVLKGSQDGGARKAIERDYKTKKDESRQNHKKQKTEMDRRFRRKKEKLREQLAQAGYGKPHQQDYSYMEAEERDEIETKRRKHISWLQQIYNSN